MIPVPEQALVALTSSFDIDRQRLVFLGGGRGDSDGIAYLYPWQNQARVLKIVAIADTGPDALVRIQERLKFFRFLGEHGVPIVYPIARDDGSLLATARTPEHTFAAYIMEKISGRSPGPEQWNQDLYRGWGKTIGQVHRVSQLYPSWRCSSIDSSGRTVLGWLEEWQGFYDWARDSDIQRCWLDIRKQLEALPVTRDAFGFTHNDPHHQNILVLGQQVVLLDFDVANYHWFASDIAISMQGLLFMKTGGLDRPLIDSAPLHEFLAAFLEGYELENHLDPYWIDRLNLFISYRRLLLFTVMQDWLDKKPKARATWKRMIAERPAILSF